MPGIESVVKVMVGDPSQASVAVAVPKSGVAGHSIGLTTVGHVIIGAVLSSTTIVLEHVDAFPQSSVAVHVLTNVYS